MSHPDFAARLHLRATIPGDFRRHGEAFIDDIRLTRWLLRYFTGLLLKSASGRSITTTFALAMPRNQLPNSPGARLEHIGDLIIAVPLGRDRCCRLRLSLLMPSN